MPTLLGACSGRQSCFKLKSNWQLVPLADAQFKQIEDRAVDDAIALQESVGLEIVTDGEMRRQSFQSQMTAAVSGFGEHNLDAFLWGEWYDETGVKKTRRPRRLGAVGN